MSGGNVAYHLRPNKLIDRQLFIEVLTRFHGFRPLTDYTYIGFGGPFLEDFKLIEAHFRLRRLVSLEGDAAVLDRQKFNRPFSHVDCRRQTSGEFVANYSADVDGNAVVWLDYANANDRCEQLGEFEALLSRVRPHDVVKLTMNANAASLPVRAGLTGEDLQQARHRAAALQLGDHWDPSTRPEDITQKGFPAVLLKAARRVARRALPGSRVTFVPFTSFAYADSQHTMLTLTGSVCPQSEAGRLRRVMRLREWDLALGAVEEPIVIIAPVLSARERHLLESLLPRYRKSLASRVRFTVAANEEDSDSLLASFARFHRYYPQFSRVLL